MTSLSENFGLAAFEAMRRSLPVLTVPDVGMSEIVRDAGAGAVVAPSLEGIAGGLGTLLADRAASRAMGLRGRERVLAEYGWDAIATRMSAVYRSAIEGNRRA
jgi:glycosyltransferase involved in cell wall biosynthesis